MRIKKVFLLIISFVLTSGSLINPMQNKNHFYDENNEAVERVEFIYDELKKYFKEKMPEKITIKYIKTEISVLGSNSNYFNPRNGSIFINEMNKSDFIRFVAHESSHLCMAYITSNLSLNENYRFFDEGFASIFENLIINKYENIALNQLEYYKKIALAVSAAQYNKDNVTFKKVQKWSEYFGNNKGKTSCYAAPVSSSFIFYIFDTYGADKFFQFLIDIARFDNIDKSFQNIFKKNKSEIEKEWQEYLKKIKIE